VDGVPLPGKREPHEGPFRVRRRHSIEPERHRVTPCDHAADDGRGDVTAPQTTTLRHHSRRWTPVHLALRVHAIPFPWSSRWTAPRTGASYRGGWGRYRLLAQFGAGRQHDRPDSSNVLALGPAGQSRTWALAWATTRTLPTGTFTPRYSERIKKGVRMSREPDAIVAQRRQLGAVLATFRKAAEQSQAQLGTRTRYDRTSINKIEHGQQLPDRPFWQAVDKLLHADGALLKRCDELVASKREHAQRQRQSSRARHQADAAHLRGERAATSALLNSDGANEPVDDPEPDPVLSAPWSRRGTVEASVVLRGGENRVQRRHFVFLTGAALTAPAHQWLVHEPGPLASGLSGRRVSAKLIDRLTPMVSELRKMDDIAGGGSVLSLAAHEFQWVAGLLDRAGYDERTGRALHVVLAELGQLCGWAAYDAGHHALAQRYYVTALRATHSADDRPLGAHVLSLMAEQAARQGQPAEAVTLIETALAGTRGR
jgi:transcriptional regulator with XRE-family HTH domain